MSSKLKQYFPLIRSREEILTEIEANERMNDLFICWPHAIREEFLDFCSGVRGSKMMYDFMSKQILDPDAHRSRVNDFFISGGTQCLLFGRFTDETIQKGKRKI